MPSLPRETWGISIEELHAASCTSPEVDPADSEEETLDDADSENEEENLPIDDELLDVAEEFALADEYHHLPELISKVTIGLNPLTVS